MKNHVLIERWPTNLRPFILNKLFGIFIWQKVIFTSKPHTTTRSVSPEYSEYVRKTVYNSRKLIKIVLLMISLWASKEGSNDVITSA